jgi:hypothetical protein
MSPFRTSPENALQGGQSRLNVSDLDRSQKHVRQVAKGSGHLSTSDSALKHDEGIFILLQGSIAVLAAHLFFKNTVLTLEPWMSAWQSVQNWPLSVGS